MRNTPDIYWVSVKFLIFDSTLVQGFLMLQRDAAESGTDALHHVAICRRIFTIVRSIEARRQSAHLKFFGNHKRFTVKSRS